MSSRTSACTFLLPLLLGAAASQAVLAAGDVTEIHTTSVPAIPFSYTVDGFTYHWGMGDNQLMTGFSTPFERYGYAMSANRVEVRRDDIADLTSGEPCGIFVERLADGENSQSLAADYPSDGSGTGNCDIPAMLASRVINRGAVDLFSNVLPDAKNIERLDYIFDYGLLAPLQESAMAQAGHVVSEKSSNNAVKIAAILSLDAFGQPSSYGPLLLVDRPGCTDPHLCYSTTSLTHHYTFLQNEFNSPQGFPTETQRTSERVGMAYISTALLGLHAGQRYFGFSFFADDVDRNAHVLTDPSSFPNDTSDDDIVMGDDADIYGGLSGYFVSDALSVASGRVFKDENGDGQPTDDEAGISHISISVYADSDHNGAFDPRLDAPMSDPIDSDLTGHFVLPGLPDGTFFVVLQESDPDLPPGLVVQAGTNPQLLLINGNDPSDVNFAFVNIDGGTTTGGGTGGAADGGTDSGSADSGGGDTGSVDGGGSDTSGNGTGGTDSGTSGAGGSDAGSSDAGSDTGGTSTAGGDDAGSSDAGGADTAGTDTGGTTSGSSDAGGADTSGAETGGGDTGSSDSGGADTGGADTSGGETGGSDAGASDAGTDTNGTTDSGSTDGATTGGQPGITDPIDDPATMANPDMFDVNSGQSATVDVLANDIDGAGGGLVINSISESPNATITEQNGIITYTPNFGFYGTDSFLYVIQDIDGTQATGTVTANVVRFSDMNNNGQNDFDECACTNLTLETGIRGSGVGSISMLTSFVLMIWFIGRVLVIGRRRNAGGQL